jgi:hypothetical protein
MISEPRALTCLQPRKTSPCWSPAVWCDTHGTRKETVNLYAPLTPRFGLTVSPGVVDRVLRCDPAGGSPVRDAGHVCRTHALGRSRSGAGQHGLVSFEDLRVRTSSVAARSARPPRSYRVRYRRLELCGPRRRSDEGCVKRLAQGCSSTLEKSESRLRLFSPASTPLERQSV